MSRIRRVSPRRLIAAAVTLILSAGMVVAIAPAAHAAPSSNADLSLLSLEDGGLSPEFDADTTTYTSAIPSAVHTVLLVARAADGSASVTIDGRPAMGGHYYPVDPGDTSFVIVVTAEDGVTKKTYTITMTRPISANADAFSLQLTAGVLSPAFARETTSYSALVSHVTTEITASAVKFDSRGKLELNGHVSDSWLTSVMIPLSFGPNVIDAVITAEDGVTTKTYRITVTRPSSASSDATLSALTSDLTSVSFAPATTDYSIAMDADTMAYFIQPVASSAYATVTIDGLPYIPGTRFVVWPKPGVQVIPIVVTAEDGVTQKTYTIAATRPVSTSAVFTGLSLSHGTLSPVFAESETSYTAAVSHSITEINVGAASWSYHSTLTVNGVSTPRYTFSAAIPLKVGDNLISAVYTAEDGVTTKTVTVTVTRAASSNANLSGITLSVGALSPAFAAATTSYIASVGYLTDEITLAAGVADSTATTTINGQPGASATVPLTVGENTITIVATAEDGSVVTTTVIVTRPVAPDIGFDLGFAPGDVSAGAPVTVTGANMLPGSVVTLTMHSTPIVLGTGTVLADGTIVVSTRLPAGVEPGAHRLVFEGIAHDGTPVTRTAWFTVLRNGTIGAVSLTGPAAYIDPAATAVRAIPVTGADTGPMAAVGAAIVTLGALLLILGAALRRRRSAV